MRFYTPELVVRMNSRDTQLLAQAISEWETRDGRYADYLQKNWRRLPIAIRQYCEQCRLHDATLAVAAESPRSRAFRASGSSRRTLSLWLLVTQQERLISLHYELTGRTMLQSAGWPPELCSTERRWLYDEFRLLSRGLFSHEILLSTGELFRIRFRKLRWLEGDWIRPGSAKKLRAVS